jgi:hypothetical protein
MTKSTGELEQSGIAFDALAAEWCDGYEERRSPLLSWIQLARETVAADDDRMA